MTRIITISSGKGGVGKTTLTANLGAAMNDMGKKVLVVDTNLTTPNLGFHLGVPLYPKTLHDVLRGEAYPEEATYTHPTGLNIIPAGISITDMKSCDGTGLDNVILDLVGEHDVILLDGAAGLGKEGLSSIKAADEMIVVTNPQLATVTDALKAVKMGEEMGTHIIGVVLNRKTGKPSDLSIEEVEALLGHQVIAELDDHDTVQDALASKTPVVHFAPDSKPAHEIKRLAASLVGLEYTVPVQKDKTGFFSKIFGFLRK